MAPFLKELEQFFKDHQILLEEYYPGIKWSRLKEDWSSFMTKSRLLNSSILGAANTRANYDYYISCLKKGRPLQYIQKQAFFYNAHYYVDERVLIPRFETEYLVHRGQEIITAKRKINDSLRIADIGTGSGCVLLSLLKELSFPVKAIGVDLSPDALKVAQLNYFRLAFGIHPETECEFHLSDRFSYFAKQEQQFDLIISNPPYIKEGQDRSLVHHKVEAYEPHMALYLPDEAYERWFLKLFKEGKKLLKSDGYFILEGHEHHLEFLQKLAKEVGYSGITLVADLTNRHRFLELRK